MRCEICQAQKDKIIKSQLDVDPTKDSLIVANSKRVVTGSRGRLGCRLGSYWPV